jgi:serine/threonine protein kinase
MAADPNLRLSPELTASTESRIELLAPVAAVERFDDYAIVGKLGVGGMAEVFLALSTGPSGFRKLLVVKRVHAHLGDDPALVRMFLDEARLAARLNHPHVVQTYKVGSVNGRPFLAMEYLDGQAGNRVLKRSLDRDRSLPFAVTARLIADVLDGLDYAHNATDFDGSPLAVVHRDISPHNVFVGYDGTVKVLDFGIAKAATSESNTRTGTIKGKFAYIAPEQARGESIDGRADVWSTGVSMWELLTGKRLFRRSTDVAVLQATLSDPIPLASDLDPAIPAELARICDRALQRDVEQRWASARIMREAIEEWLATRGREGTRSAIATLMKDLFAEDIDEQRARIKECVERVQSGTGDHATLSQMLPLTGAESADEASTRVARRGGSSSGVARSPLASDETGTGAQRSPKRQAAWMLLGLGAIAIAIVTVIIAWPRGAPTLPTTATTPEVATPETTPVVSTAPVTTVTAAPPGDAPSASAVPASALPPTTSEAIAEPESGHHEHGRRPARPVTPPPTQAATVAPAPSTVPPESAVPATGHLVLDASPYAIVTLEGRRLGITPIEVDLRAGAHVLTLRNPEQGLETTYRVTIRGGETVRRTVALE